MPPTACPALFTRFCPAPIKPDKMPWSPPPCTSADAFAAFCIRAPEDGLIPPCVNAPKSSIMPTAIDTPLTFFQTKMPDPDNQSRH